MVLSLGVIGLGVIAPYYLASIERSPSLTLGAACDLDRDKLTALEAPGAFLTTDYRELVLHEDIDAVVITAPNHLHAEMCLTALAAGRHVCCEKPLVMATGEAKTVSAAAQRAERVLFTAFHRRYNRNVRELAAWLRAHGHEHGGVERCRVRYLERIEDHCGTDRWYLDPARSGGGAVADNGPNAFDVVELLLGRCEVVDARIERGATGADIRAGVVLATADGAPAEVELDWAYDRGELKDVLLEMKDGVVRSADMLEGFPAFKSSLDHEYDAILEDFTRAIDGQPHEGGHGPDLVRLVEETYAVANELEAARPDVA